MITLGQACKIVLSNYPDKHIWTANEFDDYYEFVMLNNGDHMGDMGIVAFVDVVMKADGQLKKNVFICDLPSNNIIAHYDKDQIKKILKEAS